MTTTADRLSQSGHPEPALGRRDPFNARSTPISQNLIVPPEKPRWCPVSYTKVAVSTFSCHHILGLQADLLSRIAI